MDLPNTLMSATFTQIQTSKITITLRQELCTATHVNCDSTYQKKRIRERKLEIVQGLFKARFIKIHFARVKNGLFAVLLVLPIVPVLSLVPTHRAISTSDR